MLQQLQQLPVSEDTQHLIEALQAQAANKHMTLGVFGSFSVGKSALINTLIGTQNLLPTHTNETTAIPTFIRGGAHNRIEAHYLNGTVAELSPITFHSLTAGGAVADIASIVIERDAPSWLKEIQFIDTPGRNTKFKAHLEASENALITSDAALYIMPWQGLTLEDIVYIKHILRYQPNLYFVVNKVDRIDEAQGVTIEQLQEHVANELKEQLGKTFPVFAVSALTGYNIDVFYTEFILPLKNQISELKTRRVDYALKQLLQQEKEQALQQIQFYEQALAAEGTDMTLQKQQLQLQYEQAQLNVTKQLGELRETIGKTEDEMKVFVHHRYQKLESTLKNIAKQSLSLEQLTLQVENELVSTRNELFEALHGRISKVVGEHQALELSEVDDVSVQFIVPTVDLAHVQANYEQQRTKHLQKIEAVQQQLATLPLDDQDASKRERLENELALLTEQAVEQFVPEYIYDETFDAAKGEKIASAIGFVGDMALTVGLAVATAGASAAAQVGGKVAAKEATKTVAKGAAKQAAKEAAKAAAKEAAKKAAMKEAFKTASKKVVAEAAEKVVIQTMSKPDQEDGTLLKAAKTLDMVTSPVQTVAKKIGQNIDASRTQPKKEDLQHRQQFFTHKFEVESERDRKIQQLEELEKKAASNERLRQELSLKREQVEKAVQAKLTQLETQYEAEVARVQQAHVQQEIDQQLQQVLADEERYLHMWFKVEIENLLNAAQHMLPKQLTEQLHDWEQQIEQLASLKTEDFTKIQQLIAQKQGYIEQLDALTMGE